MVEWAIGPQLVVLPRPRQALQARVFCGGNRQPRRMLSHKGGGRVRRRRFPTFGAWQDKRTLLCRSRSQGPKPHRPLFLRAPPHEATSGSGIFPGRLLEDVPNLPITNREDRKMMGPCCPGRPREVRGRSRSFHPELGRVGVEGAESFGLVPFGLQGPVHVGHPVFNRLTKKKRPSPLFPFQMSRFTRVCGGTLRP